MDSNKKQNSVRYKCQVRDINKKACLTRASTLTFVLSRKLLRWSLLAQLPFYATFAPTLPRYTLRQRHKCRLSGCYGDSPLGCVLGRK